MDFRPTTECPHCGATLKARTTRLAGRTLFCGYEQCGCAGAEAEREKERQVEAEAARKAVLDKAMRDWKRAGVPERYVSLDHPLAAEIAECMKRGQWVYLWGDVGTHKTTCAAAVAKRLAGGKRSALMAPMYRGRPWQAQADGLRARQPVQPDRPALLGDAADAGDHAVQAKRPRAQARRAGRPRHRQGHRVAAEGRR